MNRKRIFPVLFGVIVILLVTVGYPVLAKDTIYLPIISGPNSNVNTANVDNVDEEHILVEIVETPIWRDDIEAPISRVKEQAEELKRIATEQPKDILYVSGPETRGALIEIAGKKLQLPPGAQMDGEVVTAGQCISDGCVRPPFYLIKSGEQHAILKHDGSIYRTRTNMDQADYDEVFSFLIEVFGPFKDAEASSQ